VKNSSIIKKIFILLTILLIGISVTACDDKPDTTDIIEPNPDPTPPPETGIVYTKVSAGTYDELIGFLSSESTPYEVSLTLPEKDIFLQKNITIAANTRIIGSPNNIFTIHTENKKSGDAFYCLNLQENLELQYCEIIGYDTTSTGAGGISAGSPPLMIKAGKTLTIGKDAALSFSPSPVCNYNATYSGGGIVVGDGGSFRNLTSSIDAIFGTGISSVTINKDGAAELAQGSLNIGGTNPTFEIKNGSFTLEHDKGIVTYAVNGNTTLLENWILEDGQSLHIKSGELEVLGIYIGVAKYFEEIILDGNIRLGDKTHLYVDTEDPFPRIKGNGSIVIEPTNNLPLIQLYNPGTPPSYVSGVDTLGLTPLTNARVEISAAGWKVTRINPNLAATAEIVNDPHFVANKLNMLVDTGVTLNVKNYLLVVAGGSLDVKGTINVSDAGYLLIAGDGGIYGPKGFAQIEGTITVDKGGVFHAETASWNNIFVFPAYDGEGSLTIKNSNGTPGRARIGPFVIPYAAVAANKDIVGDLLSLTQGASLEMGKRGSQPTYKLSGEATLALPSNIFLKGEFTLNAGTSAVDTILTVSGAILTMEYPHWLVGPSGTTLNPPKIILSGSGQIIMQKDTTPPSNYYNISTAGTYKWVSSTTYWLLL